MELEKTQNYLRDLRERRKSEFERIHKTRLDLARQEALNLKQ